jgi:hypothetical protein
VAQGLELFLRKSFARKASQMNPERASSSRQQNFSHDH